MPTYIFYNPATGQIRHVHRQYYMGSPDPVEVDEKRLREELRGILPAGVETAILATDESPQPKRGYRYYVDLTSKRLMCVEKSAPSKGSRQ